MTPVLDLMQTVPIFAYLVPILFLFGFGPVAALIATIDLRHAAHGPGHRCWRCASVPAGDRRVRADGRLHRAPAHLAGAGAQRPARR